MSENSTPEFPTIEGLANLTSGTFGYQGPVLVEEAVRCYHRLWEALEKLRLAEERYSSALDDGLRKSNMYNEQADRIAELERGVRVPEAGEKYDEALTLFAEYFKENYPGPTTISNPLWHAPKLFRAVQRAMLAARPDADREGQEPTG